MNQELGNKNIWIPWYGKYVNTLWSGKLVNQDRTPNQEGAPDKNLDIVASICLIAWIILGAITLTHLSNRGTIGDSMFLVLVVVWACLGMTFTVLAIFLIPFLPQRGYLVLGREGILNIGRWKPEYLSLRDMKEIYHFPPEGKQDHIRYWTKHLILRHDGTMGIFYPMLVTDNWASFTGTLERYLEEHGIPYNPRTSNYLIHKANFRDLTEEEKERNEEFLLSELAKDPGNPEMLRILGHWHFIMGEFSRALELLQAAQEAGEDREDLHFMVTSSLRELGRQEEAFDYTTRTLERFPDSLLLGQERIWNLANAGREEEASPLLDRQQEKLEDLSNTNFEELDLVLNKVSPLLFLRSQITLLEKLGRPEKAMRFKRWSTGTCPRPGRLSPEHIESGENETMAGEENP